MCFILCSYDAGILFNLHLTILFFLYFSNDITITTPVDMLYRGVKGPITITDTGKGTKTTIEQKGFADSCIWSPYGNEAMVCIL